ncbi:hypothetical protein [Devosia nitrariae]|uniref:Secreted protein n=1 Tax=Devosia nitrariae TaxID=2071872 RepID=A0ABQ5W5R0_9HYPH|nr:hypothetical protein [Devosia nitrariae]GLQ54955.1 hypothetical protein GCM10010862_22140 [Devosia nitrariae]
MTRPVKRAPTSLKWATVGVLLSINLGVAAQQPTGDDQEAALAYAQCMRENGFTEFPDPTPDGRLQMRVNPQSAPRFRAASQACRDLAPPGFSDDKPSAEQMDALLDLSQCMRESGIAGFPDPSSSGNFDLSALADAGINPQSPAFEAAMSACRRGLGNVPMRIGG